MQVKKLKIKEHFKTFFSMFLILCFSFSSIFCGNVSNVLRASATRSDISQEKPEEIRGVWISFIDIQNLVLDKTESEFKSGFESACKKLKKYNITDIYFHVRAFADAFYCSTYFPQSHILTGTQGQNLGYDVLKTAIDIAHKYDLKLHAWFNPYRIKNAYTISGNKMVLASSNPAKTYLDSDQTDVVVTLKNGDIYYNPSSDEAIKSCLLSIKEVIENYNIDGIHLDDYFYPTTDPEFDKTSYEEYRSKGGELDLSDWRRSNVTKFIASTSALVDEHKLPFSVSPGGNKNAVFNKDYADIETWLKADLLDYICPQIYFGFEHKTLPFETALQDWCELAGRYGKKICVGLAAYKIGQKESQFAGESDKARYEWVRNHDILKRQVESVRKCSNCCGFALFRLANIIDVNANTATKEATEKELANLLPLLKIK